MLRGSADGRKAGRESGCARLRDSADVGRTVAGLVAARGGGAAGVQALGDVGWDDGRHGNDRRRMSRRDDSVAGELIRSGGPNAEHRSGQRCWRGFPDWRSQLRRRSEGLGARSRWAGRRAHSMCESLIPDTRQMIPRLWSSRGTVKVRG